MVVWKNTTDGVQDNGLTLNGNSTRAPCSFPAREGGSHLLGHVVRATVLELSLLALNPSLIRTSCQSKPEPAVAARALCPSSLFSQGKHDPEEWIPEAECSAGPAVSEPPNLSCRLPLPQHALHPEGPARDHMDHPSPLRVRRRAGADG